MFILLITLITLLILYNQHVAVATASITTASTSKNYIINRDDITLSAGASNNDGSLFELKTGTTIVGMCCNDGVILGADTRSTGGPLIMDTNKLKIHKIASHIFCCGAGTSADCDQITRKVNHDLALFRIENEISNRNSREIYYDSIQYALNGIVRSIKSAVGGRKPSSVFILGGADSKGYALFQVDESGFYRQVSYAALGSGSLDAIAVLEHVRSKHPQIISTSDHVNVTVEEATKSIRDAVSAGILNDLGSGSHIDFCIIQKGSVRRWRELHHCDSSVTCVNEEIGIVVTKHNEAVFADGICSSDVTSNALKLGKLVKFAITDDSFVTLLL